MPGVRDKIIINGRTVKGSNRAIAQEFKTADVLSSEVVEHKWLADFQDLRDEMQGYCDEYDKAQEKYLKVLRAWNKKVEHRINQKLGLIP